MIDFFHAVAGGPLVDMHVMGVGASPPDANFTASCRFADGTLATLTYTTLGSRRLPKEHVEAFLGDEVVVIEDFRAVRVYSSGMRLRRRHACDKGIRREWEAFHETCVHGGSPPISLEVLRSVTEATFRIQSATRRR